MIRKFYFIACVILALGLMACNHSKQGNGSQTKQEMKKYQDSIAKAVKDSIKQKMVSDSIAKAKADSTASAKKAAEFDIAKIYAVCKKGVDGRHYPALPAMGFKKGPSFSQDVPFGYSNYFDLYGWISLMSQLITQLSQVNFWRSNSAYSCTNMACRCEFPQIAARISSL